ncbi:MAG TPA: phosphotransferase family protein [Sphingobium sp.]|uniref:phosphotransferase family protein n=1 Tax=Sphingobium sp. TaxID=1912891 RepID=UPI002ECFD93F
MSSAPAIVAPETRDLTELSLQLEQYLSTRIPEAQGLHVFDLDYPRGAGMSHETILFDAEWQQGSARHRRGMVLRVKPMRHTMYQDDLFDVQYRIMQLMHENGQVRVPEPYWLENDSTLLGSPFFIMEKKVGRVAVSYPPYSREGWLFDSAPADRHRLWDDAVRQLAAIARVPTADAPFLTLPGGPDHFGQEVDRWARFIDWIDPAGALVLLRGTFDRLLAKAPANKADGIVWGDARIGNMLVGPDYRVAAVIDWEQPSLGGALHDLGWWLYHDYGQTEAQGIPRLEGMGNRAETIALWSEASGISADDIDWYEAFACLKMECLSVRMAAIRENPPSNVGGYTPGSRTGPMIDRL